MSPRVRYSEPLQPGRQVVLDAHHAHHLRVVLRVSQGQQVEIVDAARQLWSAAIVSLDPMTLLVGVALDASAAMPQAHVSFWLPVLKGGKTDDLVRQLTELGVTRIVPYLSERSVVRLDASRAKARHERWCRIAEEATRQCGRPDIPEVCALAGLPREGPGVYLWETEGPPVGSALKLVSGAPVLRLLTGPEGGLSSAEAQALDAQGWQAAHLGGRILRAETAVVVLMTLALNACNEGGYGV